MSHGVIVLDLRVVYNGYKNSQKRTKMLKHRQPLTELILSYSLIAFTAFSITYTGIMTSQEILRIIPLYVSLFVGMLQSRANRHAPLIGGINAILYSVVYFRFGLFASAISALLVSSPFQLATFFRWQKRAYKHSTRFKKLSTGALLLVLFVFIAAFTVSYLVLLAIGSSYKVLDLTVSLISIFTSVLTLLSFVEYSWLMLGTGIFSIALDLTMMKDYPAQITYLIFSVYSMICIIRQFFAVQRLYNEQSTTKGSNNENVLSEC